MTSEVPSGFKIKFILGAKNTQQGNGSLFYKYWESWISTYKEEKKKKREVEPLSYTTYKNQLNMIKDLNVRPETIKLRRKHIGGNLHDPELDNNMIYMTSKAQVTKTKI